MERIDMGDSSDVLRDKMREDGVCFLRRVLPGVHIRDMSKDEQIIYLGLRTGLFTTINGTSWHPACFLDEVEIPPLFLWGDGDKWSSM